MKQQGKTLPSVCERAQLAVLRHAFVQLQLDDETAAWKVLTTLLCAPRTSADARYIESISARRINQSSEYTGQDNQPQTIRNSPEVAAGLLAAGTAFDANLELLDTGFRILYFTDEACVASRDLTHHGRTWTISEIGEACD